MEITERMIRQMKSQKEEWCMFFSFVVSRFCKSYIKLYMCIG